MSSKRIYISGKITGLPMERVKEYFGIIEEHLTRAGHVAINPLTVIAFEPHLTWKDYMVADINALLTCDAIFMLENWHYSNGAKLEHHIAHELGLELYYESSHKLF